MKKTPPGDLRQLLTNLREHWGMPAPVPGTMSVTLNPVVALAAEPEPEPEPEPAAPEPAAWSVNRLKRPQRQLLAELRDCRQEKLVKTVQTFSWVAAGPLKKAGIITVDPGADEDAPMTISFTHEGGQWVRSLPADALP